jgi:hypothetical protein
MGRTPDHGRIEFRIAKMRNELRSLRPVKARYSDGKVNIFKMRQMQHLIFFDIDALINAF